MRRPKSATIRVRELCRRKKHTPEKRRTYRHKVRLADDAYFASVAAAKNLRKKHHDFASAAVTLYTTLVSLSVPTTHVEFHAKDDDGYVSVVIEDAAVHAAKVASVPLGIFFPYKG